MTRAAHITNVSSPTASAGGRPSRDRKSIAAHAAAKWVPCLRAEPVPTMPHLFCFPFAGGGASAFAKWAAEVSEQIRICPVQYPGREDRWGEPGSDSVSGLVEALGDDIIASLPQHFAFLGHSFGALIAFELTRFLARRGAPQPSRLFLSGARAPHLTPREAIHSLSDQGFLNKLRAFDGMPDEVWQNADLMNAVLPIIKKDFRIFEQYSFTPADPLAMPITVLGGLRDASVPIADLLAWSTHTSKAFRSRFYAGHHFFLFNSRSEIMRHIVDDLRDAAGLDAGAGKINGNAGSNGNE